MITMSSNNSIILVIFFIDIWAIISIFWYGRVTDEAYLHVAWLNGVKHDDNCVRGRERHQNQYSLPSL